MSRLVSPALALALPALLAMASVAPAADNLAGTEPYQWVRTLEAVQEEIGQGSRSAHTYLPRLIGQIADGIDKADPNVMLEPRNVRAVLAYSLSGGDSRSVRRLLSLGKLAPVEEQIARGALAYLEGKYSQASAALNGLDARAVDASLAGRVALTQSILVYKTDLKRAIGLLDVARLLSTGTLVEEAALRREVVLVAADNDHDRFESLSDQYFRRFKNSVYAGYFKQQFSTAAAGLEFGPEKKRLARLGDIVDSLDGGDRPELYVMIAERAIFVGNIPLTEFAATKGEDLSPEASIDRVRAQLYRASAGVAGSEPEQAMSTLRAIPAAVLDDKDAGLLAAALTVGEAVTRAPAPDGEAGGEPERAHVSAAAAASKGKAAAADDAPPDAAVLGARKLLAEADRLLSEKR